MPHTLLVADDSVTVQRVVALTFAGEDVTVVAAGDGDQAIATLDQSPPDIVLVDVGLPKRNGYEIADYVRHQPHLAHIPVLLLSGVFEPIDHVRAEEVGCAGVLAKPFEPQALIGRVRELLSGGPREGSPRSLPRTAEPHLESFDLGVDTHALEAKVGSAVTEPDAAGLDQYFDDLSTAFATIGRRQPVAEPAPQPGNRTEHEAEPEPGVVPRALPPLADVFSALLEAERQVPETASAWPSSETVANEELVSMIVRRVEARIADRALRDAVADRVSAIAERLVREEIARIKASIT